MHELLEYLQSEYVFTKVDVAFLSNRGLQIFTHNNGIEVGSFFVGADGSRISDYVEAHELNQLPLLTNANKDITNKLYRRWEAKEDEHEEFPHTMLSKVEYLGDFDDDTKAYCVAIGFKDGVQNKEVMQYFFSELTISIKTHINRCYIEKLSEIKPNINVSKISRKASIKILAERFYGNDRDARQEELYETMCLLSCAPYEKNQNRRRIGLFTPSVGRNKPFVQFEKPIEICRKNVREIRKILELSDKTKTILVAKDGKIIGVYSTENNNGKYAGTGILFRGNGKWDLFTDKVGSLISFDSVTVKLPNQSIEQRVKKGFEIAGITRYNEKAIMNIVNIAKKQSHGTTIIVSEEALFESNRLAKANRAIRIAPIRMDEDTIMSLSAIDGAMIIYTDGICYAIGAILDGVVDKTGNIARGARYNSAITYIDFGAPEKKAVAIIISSDDTVDVYPDMSFHRKLLWSNG